MDVQAVIVRALREVEPDLHKDACTEARGCGWDRGGMSDAKTVARKSIEDGAKWYVNQNKPLRGVSASIWGALLEGVDWEAVASALDLSDKEIERAWEQGVNDRIEDDDDENSQD